MRKKLLIGTIGSLALIALVGKGLLAAIPNSN